ncbi:hypothetical protein niasHS_013976 [Heterodera schachtii]|uniref:Uncharacterized protein n=1 Tax=Heterodera schachtii TaxID=97005 RepID=A0ABD2IHR8_HETSC
MPKKPPVVLCLDIWLSVFALLSLENIGIQIATASDLLEAYVFEHLKTRRWTLGFIEIRRNDQGQMEIVNGQSIPLPIPDFALPRGVCGFDGIKMQFFDENVKAFLNLFQDVFKSGYKIHLEIGTYENDVMTLINDTSFLPKTSIIGMKFYQNHLRILREKCSTFFNQCFALRSISTFTYYLDFPPDHSADASAGKALAQWMYTPLADGTPKFLLIDYVGSEFFGAELTRLENEFRNDWCRASYILIIIVPLYCDFDQQLSFENHRTGELLQLKPYQKGRFLLVRRPISSANDDQWKKWEKEAKEWQFDNQWGRLIFADDDELYDDSDEAASDQSSVEEAGTSGTKQTKK